MKPHAVGGTPTERVPGGKDFTYPIPAWKKENLQKSSAFFERDVDSFPAG